MPGFYAQPAHTTTQVQTEPIHFRDGVHSALILEFAVLITVLALALWIQFRRITNSRGGVICPHCELRYDNIDE